VRECERDDIPALARSLASAFMDDPVFEYMIPSERNRARRLPAFFSIFLRHHLRRNHTVHTTTGREAGALWAPPGEWETRILDILRMTPRLAGVLGSRAVKSVVGLQMIEKAHPREPPHWYLAVLGTGTDVQGMGFGSAVLQPVLNRCDRDGVPAYLESSKEQNIPFYRRHGFEVTGELRFGKDGPLVWPMWRDPQPGD
jgi:ribosomal protein S18 acetylase RimI-like enzyme